MGLRVKQKEKRYQSIINAALSLIQEKGYAATSIEEIAAKAEVGVGTVYNYFHTKADIVIEMYRRDITSNLNKGEEVIASQIDDYKQKVVDMLAVYAAGYYAGRDKSLLREIYSVIMSQQVLARQELLQLDNMLVEQLAGLLVQAQHQNHLKPQVDPHEAAYILFSMAMYDFMIFVTGEDMKFIELGKHIQRHSQLIFGGISR
jgi:AcrR family transcriptional regulator